MNCFAIEWAGRHCCTRCRGWHDALAIPGVRVYLKREDMAHTGAHKINNALGQGLLAARMGKTRIVAETGAGQHGVAVATVCAMLGLACVVYMGADDMARQQSNVVRMRLLGADVRAVRSGDRRLKSAVTEAVRDWVAHTGTRTSCSARSRDPHRIRGWCAIIRAASASRPGPNCWTWQAGFPTRSSPV